MIIDTKLCLFVSSPADVECHKLLRGQPQPGRHLDGRPQLLLILHLHERQVTGPQYWQTTLTNVNLQTVAVRLCVLHHQSVDICVLGTYLVIPLCL